VLQTDFEEVYDAAAFEVIHIDVDGASSSALHNHWDQHNPTFPVLLNGNPIYSQYGDGYIPFNTLLDTEGVVLYTDSGFAESTLHNLIEANMSVDMPVFTMEALSIVSDDNGDGRPDAGETVDYQVSLKNSPIAVPATNVAVTMNCDDEDVTILNGSVTFPDAEPGDIIAGDATFTFSVADEIAPHWATFYFTYTADYADGSVEETLEYTQRMGRPDLLVVDSDGGDDDNETFAHAALDGMGVEYDTFMGVIAAEEMSNYSQILWLGGRNQNDLTTAEAAGLATFMDDGGFLIFSSQYATDRSANADFIADYFGVEAVETDGGSIFVADGVEGDAFFDATAFVITGSQGANNNEEPDVLAVTGDAIAFSMWRQGTGGPAAVYTARDNYNAIFCGFAVEASRVHSSVDGSIDMTMFLERAFDFNAQNSAIDDSAPVLVDSFRLTHAYPNPFNPATTVSFALPMSADVTLAVFNTLGQQVALLNQGQLQAGSHQVTFDAASLSSGVYVIELRADSAPVDAMRVTLVK
jgi:hypothetical protein